MRPAARRAARNAPRSATGSLTRVLRALALAAAVVVCGCAAPQVSSLVERAPPSLAARAEITDTPFFAQEQYQCGPASLAAAFNHAGIRTTPDALKPAVYLPGREGSLQAEMLAATRRAGLVAHRVEASLEALLREVAAGTPAIVLQNLSFGFAPLWHYAVVVGYDLPAEQIVLRSGVTERLAMSMSAFERTWARSGHWAMLALPPARLPASASAQAYVASVIALERIDPAAARVAYAAALGRWPEDLPARIGLGNTAYAMRDLPAAEAAYRQATRDHPGSADAWNNLAQTLLELGRGADARDAAQTAVAIGGPRLERYRETLRAIEAPR